MWIDPKHDQFITIFQITQVDPATNVERTLGVRGPGFVTAMYFQRLLNHIDPSHIYILKARKWTVSEWLDKTVNRN